MKRDYSIMVLYDNNACLCVPHACLSEDARSQADRSDITLNLKDIWYLCRIKTSYTQLVA